MKKEYGITELGVGSSFIDIDINNGEAEMKFFQVPEEVIQQCLDSFGLKLTKEELEDYEY